MALNSSSQEMTKTREQVKEERKQNTEEKASSKQKVRVRLFPVWLRVIVIILLMALSIMAGAVVGYSVMGSGKASDTFKKETWTHIVDLVNEK